MITKERLSKLSKEEKLVLFDVIQEKKARLKSRKEMYKPNAGQLPIHLSEKTIKFCASGNGCWAPGTEIRMYDGTTKRVEDIEVGDELLGPDSQKRVVQKLYSGEEEMYKIIPKFSDPYVVNASHCLSLYTWKSKRENCNQAELRYSEPTVKEYLCLGPETKRKSYQWRPEAGVDYPERSLDIDPYVLGAWLGDGTSSTLAITTMDKEILNRCEQYFGPHTRSDNKSTGKATTYFWSHNEKRTYFKDLLNNKHIPHPYMVASQEQRLELLAGLIDTDGHVKYDVEITQKRKDLANQIRELSQSLGFNTSIRTKVINGVPYYRVRINGPVWSIPTRVPHKQAKVINQQRASWKEPFKVVPAGRGQFYGFQVDKDHLVLLRDYTVQRNSGKTACAVNEAVWAAQGYHPIKDVFTKVPAQICVVLDKPNKADTVWLPEVKKWFNTDKWQISKAGRPNTTVITLPNGSQITFFSHDQDYLTFESIELDAAIYDEPPYRHIFIALRRGTRKKGTEPWHLIIGTPLTGTWLRTEIWEPWARGELQEAECFKMSSDVNKENINWEAQEKNFKFMTEREQRIRRQGDFFDLEGQALAHLFDRGTHIIDASRFEWDKDNPCVLAIDPHGAKPHVALILGADRDNKLYALKEFSLSAPPRTFAQALKKEIEGYRLIDIVVDSYGQNKGKGVNHIEAEGFKSFVQVLRDEGIQARATSYHEKQDEQFITRIQEALIIPEEEDNLGQRLPKLRVLSSCPGLIMDIEQVQWQRDKKNDVNKPKLDIQNTDRLACLKYALATNLSYGKSKAIVQYSNVPRSYGNHRTKREKVLSPEEWLKD